MKKIVFSFIVFLIIFVIVFISYIFLKRTATQPSIIKNIEELPSSEVFIGIIEGSLGYPSEYVPEMKICAENIKNKEKFCSYEMINDEKFLNKIGYQIELPAGKYYVYSQLIDEKQKEIDDYKAYYTKFVTCGMSIDCESHKKIEIEVAPRKTTTDINPIDWYDF